MRSYSSTTVIVNLTEHPQSEPETSWIIALDSLDMSVEDTASQLESLTWLSGEQYPVMSSLNSRHGVHNWGASSSFAEFILNVSAGGLGGLGAAAVDAAVRDLFGKFRERSAGDQWGNVISEEDAARVALARISTQYGVPSTELTIHKALTDAANCSHEFSFKHADGRAYGAVVGIVEDSPTCMRLWREVAPDSA
ncbi:hypothetical protein [Streptomyces sparsus]